MGEGLTEKNFRPDILLESYGWGFTTCEWRWDSQDVMRRKWERGKESVTLDLRIENGLSDSAE